MRHDSKNKHVIVMVLGDVGRSPRMQYHALSLSQMDTNLHVSLVGYAGEKCIPELYKQSNVSFQTFTPCMQRISRSLFLLFAPIKVLLQLFQLFWILLIKCQSFDMILLQNPPTIPTFIVAWICCRIMGAKLLIDWHNLGYSVLGLSLGEKHVLVKIAKWIERYFGQKADGHFCVTKALQLWLQENWSINAIVLYDKPPPFFHPTPLEQQHELFQRLALEFEEDPEFISPQEYSDETIMTIKCNGAIQGRPNREALVVSSTSWTRDEDFGLLLNALVKLNARIENESSFPNILVVVTGKGPEKEMYCQQIVKLAMNRIRIVTLWLEAKDYPVLLGSADVGVCLHTSTSGLDLPMKVLDMFGCHVPVCAVGFSCLDELVQHEKNGLIFHNEQELAEQLHSLLKDLHHTEGNKKLEKLRKALVNVEQWPSNWNTFAGPAIKKCLEKHITKKLR